jgi:hypothetical protein
MVDCRPIMLLCTVSGALSCVPKTQDDPIARRFIEEVRSGDRAGDAQRQPGSQISSIPWRQFTDQFAEQFPPGTWDSVKLIAWEKGRDDEGGYRKLTYLIHSSAGDARAEVWLVAQDGRTYVNTFRLVGPEQSDE